MKYEMSIVNSQKTELHPKRVHQKVMEWIMHWPCQFFGCKDMGENTSWSKSTLLENEKGPRSNLAQVDDQKIILHLVKHEYLLSKWKQK